MKLELFNKWRAMILDPLTPLKNGSIGDCDGSWDQDYLNCGCAVTALYACSLDVKITELKAKHIISNVYMAADAILGYEIMNKAVHQFDGNANLYGVDEARHRFVGWMDFNKKKLVEA